MRKPQWAVHAEVLIKMFHPKLAKSEMWHCVSHGKMFQSRERGPWEGSSRGCWGQCVCGPCCLRGAADRSHAGGCFSRNDISHGNCFQVIYCWDAFGSWWNCLAGFWALYFENRSPFSLRYKWQVGFEAEPSKVCFVHQLMECVRLPPLTNGNKTDKSSYMVFDNIFEGLLEAC